jgi:hypothetical protein
MEDRGDHLSLNQGSFFCQVEISQSVLEFGGVLGNFGKPLASLI